jgi:hypothetical protein
MLYMRELVGASCCLASRQSTRYIGLDTGCGIDLEIFVMISDSHIVFRIASAGTSFAKKS